jgi:acetyltransferase-like isoleucine patch superfamily enzyme
MAYTPLIKKIGDERHSSIQKYQDLFVGSRSVGELLRYELISSAFGLLPGALGLYLRSKAYPWLFKKCGEHVFFGRGVTIRVPTRIELGDNVIVDDHAVLDAKGDPEASFIRCGNDVEIGRNSILSCKDVGSISLGNFVSIGRNVLLSASSELVVGDNCSIGPYSCLLASGHAWDDPNKPVLLQNREIKKIVIESNVWLGAHVVVMDGVTIGKNSIIGAGSVVTQDVAPYRIASGMPARVIHKREPLGAEIHHAQGQSA